MQNLRKVISWCFLFESLLFLAFLWRNLLIVHQQSFFRSLLGERIAVSILIVIATIFAIAWWTVWKQKPSAKGWGFTASLCYLLIFLQPHVFKLRFFPVRNTLGHTGALFLGIAGLLIFLGRGDMKTNSDTSDLENA